MEAVVAAFIGVGGVVLGVVLAHILARKQARQLAVRRVTRELNEEGRLLYEALRKGPPTSLAQGDEIASWLGRLREVEDLAGELSPKHRQAVFDQVDEARAMWVVASWRIISLGGQLPEAELLALLSRTNAVFLSMDCKPSTPLADLNA